MQDEWTRRLADGRVIRYTREQKAGYSRITATVNGQTKVLEMDGGATREEVEEHFEIAGLD
jgi:hypothetical protein